MGERLFIPLSFFFTAHNLSGNKAQSLERWMFERNEQDSESLPIVECKEVPWVPLQLRKFQLKRLSFLWQTLGGTEV